MKARSGSTRNRVSTFEKREMMAYPETLEEAVRHVTDAVDKAADGREDAVEAAKALSAAQTQVALEIHSLQRLLDTAEKRGRRRVRASAQFWLERLKSAQRHLAGLGRRLLRPRTGDGLAVVSGRNES